MNLLLIPLIPLVGAGLPALSIRLGRNQSAWTAGAVAALALTVLLFQAPTVFAGHVVSDVWDWLPQAGLQLSFRLDGLSLLFALLILGIGLLVILYARYYLSPDDPMGRFYALLLLFMGSMLGVVLAGNILLMLVFWELTSLSSFLLIGYWKHRADARQGARMALAVTGSGGLALLAGLLILGQMAGSYDLASVLERGAQIQADPRYPLALVLILIGAFTKSAQFPFHFWLPHAMAAPTPVSAYLHSATMVKLGVFLLARLFPALAGTEWWLYLVGGVGMITLLFAAYTALFQHDLKGLLAYSTISHLGLITLLFGMGTPLAAVAGVFHIINHATFKASLFMAAGIIDHETGTRDMRRINGLWKYMPHTAALAIIAASAMAGVPLLNGFLSKEMFFSEAVALAPLGEWGWLLPLLATLAGVFSVTYSVRFIHDVFFNGEPIDLPRSPHEPPRYMKVPVEVLVTVCLLVGTLPGFTIGALLQVAASSVVGVTLPNYSLNIWHGFSLPLLMSTIALVAGVALYTQRRWMFYIFEEVLPPLSGRAAFDWALRHLLNFAHKLTELLENGSLQRYLALLAGSALALAGAQWMRNQTGLPVLRFAAPTTLDPVAVVAWGCLMLTSIVVVLFHRQRLFALIAMGVIGLVVSLTFARLSAPDLALTQLSVEIATIILMLLALYFLPQQSPAESSLLRRGRDAVLALCGGLGMALLAWDAMLAPGKSISDFYLRHSVGEAGGRNVVNVILVDFRGFDTLGESTVLAIAALGIFALLGSLYMDRPHGDDADERWSQDPHPLVLQVLSRLLLPLALMVSVFVLLRGHNAPGGGFIAGLVTSIALILQYLASGATWARDRLHAGQRTIIALGLTLATGTGLASLLFGAPFLTSSFGHFTLPLVGDIELASAMAFDIGVFLTVIGSVMLILARLGRVSGPQQAGEPTWSS